MKILFVNETALCWQSGIWFHRVNTPADALKERGHHVRQVTMGNEFSEEILDWPDVVIFGRTYYQEHDPLRAVAEFKKRGKRILYDMDDDFWQVQKHNPSVVTSNALKDQYEGFIKAADAIITPSKALAKKFKRFKKPVFLCPNGVDFNIYKPATRRDPSVKDELVIGYFGGSSHWKDLSLIIEPLEELSLKHNFVFTLYGITAGPIDAEIYSFHKALQYNLKPEQNAYYKAGIEFYDRLQNLRMLHKPFIPPELHPMNLAAASIDIGLCPLEKNEFNAGKSCLKFYEYVATGSVVLASDVEPYSDEVNYTCKNTTKDWVKKLEKLIVDPEFREKIRKQQYDWVLKNRNAGGMPDPLKPEIVYPGIGLPWEMACQLPGGLKVLNQK